jgi:hypothetical protein
VVAYLNCELLGRDLRRAVEVAQSAIDPNDPRAREMIDLYVRNDFANRDTVVALLEQMSADNRGRRLVVRPHPAENPEPWQKTAPQVLHIPCRFHGTGH